MKVLANTTLRELFAEIDALSPKKAMDAMHAVRLFYTPQSWDSTRLDPSLDYLNNNGKIRFVIFTDTGNGKPEIEGGFDIAYDAKFARERNLTLGRIGELVITSHALAMYEAAEDAQRAAKNLRAIAPVRIPGIRPTQPPR